MALLRNRRFTLLGLLAAGVLTLGLSSTAGATTYRPTPQQAPNDKEILWHDGCLGWDTTTTPRSPDCVFGDPNGSTTVALVGDSHTSDLFPGFNIVAKAHHWRLVVFVKINCPFLDIAIRSPHVGQAPYPQCATWNANVVARLQSIKPDLTVTIPMRYIFPRDSSQDTPAREGAAIGRELAKVPGRRMVIVDTPWSSRDVPTCIESHSPAYCAIPRSVVLSGGVRTREKKAASVSGGTYVDLTSKICGGWPCRVVTGDILMFRDSHHLTATFARSFAPVLDTTLTNVLGG